MKAFHCCARGQAEGRVVVEAVVRDQAEAILYSTDYVPPPAAFHVCVHEAAHAVATHALGGIIDSVTVADRRVAFVANRDADKPVVVMIGGLAENKLRGWRITASDEALAHLLDRAAAGQLGHTCDECRLGRMLTGSSIDFDIARAKSAFRRAEAHALAMLDERPFWLAVLAVARALDTDQTLIGEDVHEIAAGFMPVGAYPFTP